LRKYTLLINYKLKRNFKQAFPFWIASIIAGLIAVLYAKLFSITETASSLFLKDKIVWAFAITPICFVIAWWIVHKFAPYAKGSGIPAVMAALDLANPKKNQSVNKLLSLRIVATKIVSSLILLFGGGAIGREGPTVQIASSIFRVINENLPNSWPKISKKNMILAGAAAGLAAAFNTPLGGIVFAVEELSKTHFNNFKTAIFTTVIIAGLTAQAILGPYLYLGYPNVNGIISSSTIYVIIVGLIAGILGSILGKIIVAINAWKSNVHFKGFNLVYIICCALLLAAFANMGYRDIFYSGKSQMTDLLFNSDKFQGWHLPIVRTLGPLLSFTSGASGGVFAPSLSAGAAIGSVFAHILNFTASNANILILSGMVAFLTGITRSPFTSAILVLEMTDSHNIIFHLMLASIASYLISMLIDKHSFYDHLKNQYLKEIESNSNV
jgi:H+/Cl- antiporter ClcA